jgi:hypothetical protein
MIPEKPQLNNIFIQASYLFYETEGKCEYIREMGYLKQATVFISGASGRDTDLYKSCTVRNRAVLGDRGNFMI